MNKKMNHRLSRGIGVIVVGLCSFVCLGCAPTAKMLEEQRDIDDLMKANRAELSADDQELVKEQEAEKKGQRDFAGLSFGVGLSLTVDTGENDRVNKAQIVNDIVRVDDVDDTVARVMLESHYFFLPDKRFINVRPGNWGFGPFVALQPGTDEVIEAVGMGLMFGFKRPGESSDSWNFGIGAVVDPNVQILGDGFVANEAPPAGEMQVRFKEKSQTGVLFLVSFGF